MPGFLPFPALRYSADSLDDLVAPPYDVLSPSEVEALHARSPHNITHVDVPAGGADRYRDAGRLLERWIGEGVLVVDAAPSLTLYRLQFTDAAGAAREIVGILGGLQVLDPDQQEVAPVLPHERTTPKASTDRLDLTRATRANVSPVWGLSLAAGLTGLLTEPGERLGAVTDAGVTHQVEKISDPGRITAISTLIGSDAVLLADGHHRYGVARTYRDEVRARTGRTDGAAEHTLAFVSELVADQLSVEAIHRLYRGIGADDLRRRLEERFEVTDANDPTPATLARMESDGFLVLLTTSGAYRLSPRPGAFAEIRALDGLWLEETLGTDVETDYQHGLAETRAAVAEGRAEAAVLIRPVGVAEIERTAREGLLMPPKSTFFTPKLKTGLVLRRLH